MGQQAVSDSSRLATMSAQDTKTEEGQAQPVFPPAYVSAHMYADHPAGLAHGQGPYGHYPHGLSKAVATRFTQPYFGGGFHGHGGPAAYPGAFPGHPGLATGAPYQYSQPLPSAGGSYGGYGKEYGAAGWPHPVEHHGYRPNGRGHWGFQAPKYENSGL